MAWPFSFLENFLSLFVSSSADTAFAALTLSLALLPALSGLTPWPL